MLVSNIVVGWGWRRRVRKRVCGCMGEVMVIVWVRVKDRVRERYVMIEIVRGIEKCECDGMR